MIYTEAITKAYNFAKAKHKDKKDDEGNNYFEAHCRYVFDILYVLEADENLLCAALLHDTLEDTETTYDELKNEFCEDIANLVNEVTHEWDKGYYFPRLNTQRGIMLKFADRLSNLSRMQAWDEERQEYYLKKSKFWRSEKR